MVSGVDHDRVARRQDRAERADVRLVAGGEDERRFGLEPFGELALELDVEVGGAIEEPGSGQSGPIAVERVERGLLDAFVSGQPEVVVRPEHDPPLSLHLDDRQRRALEHVEIRERVELARELQALDASCSRALANTSIVVGIGRHAIPALNISARGVTMSGHGRRASRAI